MSNIAVAELNERQKLFVEAILAGARPIDAQKVAGYQGPSAYLLQLKNPAVMFALQYGVNQMLAGDAGPNLRVLRKIRDDEKAPARVRADIALKLLALAGYVAPTTLDDAPPKALSDMSQDELVDYINRNQEAIDRSERELMARAKDVSVTNSVAATQTTGPKPQSFLE